MVVRKVKINVIHPDDIYFKYRNLLEGMIVNAANDDDAATVIFNDEQKMFLNQNVDKGFRYRKSLIDSGDVVLYAHPDLFKSNFDYQCRECWFKLESSKNVCPNCGEWN